MLEKRDQVFCGLPRHFPGKTAFFTVFSPFYQGFGNYLNLYDLFLFRGGSISESIVEGLCSACRGGRTDCRGGCTVAPGTTTSGSLALGSFHVDPLLGTSYSSEECRASARTVVRGLRSPHGVGASRPSRPVRVRLGGLVYVHVPLGSVKLDFTLLAPRFRPVPRYPPILLASRSLLRHNCPKISGYKVVAYWVAPRPLEAATGEGRL